MTAAPLFLLALIIVVFFALADSAAAQGDTTVTPQAPTPPPDTSGITSDPSTWPSGNGIWDLCQGIAHAEGADSPNTVPDRLNNPGDISDGAKTYGSQYHDGSYVTVFPDKATGWQWLYNKVQNACTGASGVYHPQMTILDMANVWQTGSGQNWANNIVWWLNNQRGYNIDTSYVIGSFAATNTYQ